MAHTRGYQPKRREIFFTGIDFIDENYGFVCGYNGSILKTSDGGEHWEKIRNGNNIFKSHYRFNDIAANAGFGYAVAEDGIMIWFDSKENQIRLVKDVPHFNIRGIFIGEYNHGTIVGSVGKIYDFTGN